MNFFKKLVRNNKAATAIEHGLIAALIAVAGITVMGNVGTSVKGTVQKVDDGLKNAGS